MAKHNLKITTILLVMFIITQLIGLAVISFYLDKNNTIPYGFDNKETLAKNPTLQNQMLVNIVSSLVIAILIILLIIKTKTPIIMRIWFFIVVSLAIGITLTTLTLKLNIPYASVIAMIIGIILAYFKIFKRNIILHNLTELIIYPGIAAIFVTMLNLNAIIILLAIISVYDMWAVWKSGIMQKMAKYQITTLGVLGGFLLPHATKQVKDKIKFLKLKYKNNIPESVMKKNNIKINLAILGGGDIVFPLIATGVMLKTFTAFWPALIVMFFSILALAGLLLFSKRKKSYPAMPYLTAGIYLGMLIVWLITKII